MITTVADNAGRFTKKELAQEANPPDAKLAGALD